MRRLTRLAYKAATDLNRPHPSFPPSVIIAVVDATPLSVSPTVATSPRAAPYTRLSSLGDRGKRARRDGEDVARGIKAVDGDAERGL